MLGGTAIGVDVNSHSRRRTDYEGKAIFVLAERAVFWWPLFALGVIAGFADYAV